jgi:hypothetical protein
MGVISDFWAHQEIDADGGVSGASLAVSVLLRLLWAHVFSCRVRTGNFHLEPLGRGLTNTEVIFCAAGVLRRDHSHTPCAATTASFVVVLPSASVGSGCFGPEIILKTSGARTRNQAEARRPRGSCGLMCHGLRELSWQEIQPIRPRPRQNEAARSYSPRHEAPLSTAGG